MSTVQLSKMCHKDYTYIDTVESVYVYLACSMNLDTVCAGSNTVVLLSTLAIFKEDGEH